MGTVTVKLSDSVNYCYWTRSSGGSGTISGSGSSRTWTSTDSSEYITIFPGMADGYNYPIYYNRTDGYDQLVIDSNGNGYDRVITLNGNKIGTLNATAPVTKYTLTYNGNGHTGGKTTSTKGNGIVQVKSCGFTKTGYTFSEWNTTAYGDGYPYDPGDNINLTYNRTLYAQWTPDASYTLTYYTNGGSGSMVQQTGNGIVTLKTAEQCGFSRTGYTFFGWNTKADGSGTSYSSGDSYNLTANASLHAQWIHEDYSLSYHANGGSGSMASEFGYGNVTVDSCAFTRSGYTFTTWNTKKDGSGTSYAAGSTFNLTSDATLYAQWTPSTSYNLTYHANGGTGSMQAQSGNGYMLVLNCGFSRTDYTFRSWNTKANGSGDTYVPGDAFNLTSNSTLYAVWEPNATYNLTYHANGGTGSMQAQTGYGYMLVLNCSFSRTGYSFVEWNTQSNGQGTSYDPGDAFNLTSNSTLYAIWEEDEFPPFVIEYALDYDANGGIGFAETQYGSGYMLVLNCNFIRDGYTFNSWNTRANGTGDTYFPGDAFNLTDDSTLYAQWTEDEPPVFLYNLDYHANGGSGTMDSQLGTDYVTVQECEFERTGYDFVYWTTRSDGSGRTFYPNQSIDISDSENQDLYAQWTVKTYFIYYNANGGTGAPSYQEKIHGVNMTLRSTSPTYSGHQFLGWGYSPSASAEVYYMPGDTYTQNAGRTFYAVWECRCRFYSHSEIIEGLTRTCRIGSTIILPSLPDTDTESFIDWKSNDEYYSAGQSIGIMSNTDFEARWRATTHTITYRPNGGSGTAYVQSGELTYIIDSCSFTRSGYDFVRWTTNSDGTGTVYHPTNSVTPSSNITLYAQWIPSSYFTWHGSDLSDQSYFAVGQRIDYAVTASAWNRLITYALDLRKAAGLSQPYVATVSAGDQITIAKFNQLSNVINVLYQNGYGSISPETMASGQLFTTWLFNGGNSLKAAINSARDDF